MESTQHEVDADGYLTNRHSTAFLSPLSITVQPNTVRIHFKKPLCNILLSVRPYYNHTEGREIEVSDATTPKMHQCESMPDVHAECRLLFDSFSLNTLVNPNLGIRHFRYLNVLAMIQSYGDCSGLTDETKQEIITILEELIQREGTRADAIFSLIGVKIQ